MGSLSLFAVKSILFHFISLSFLVNINVILLLYQFFIHLFKRRIVGSALSGENQKESLIFSRLTQVNSFFFYFIIMLQAVNEVSGFVGVLSSSSFILGIL